MLRNNYNCQKTEKINYQSKFLNCKPNSITEIMTLKIPNPTSKNSNKTSPKSELNNFKDKLTSPNNKSKNSKH